MLVNRYNILKKPYVPPIIEFEELEQDELDILQTISQTDGAVDDPDEGDGDGDLKNKQTAFDFDFSMDFVVNDEPQL